MATKKDLVEAYSFSRRRLVTAFLSGAPGGREVEPNRPGRTVVGGLALAVLLVAGAAIASVLAARTQEDWNKVGLVVSRQDAAPYVILDDSTSPTLIPILNITSAQLILGADIKATYVDQSVIEDQTPGETIGIAGAPQTLPRPEQFVETGWTACTDDGLGTEVGVSTDDRVTVPENGGTVVKSGGQVWVIARSGSEDLDQRRAFRYLLPVREGDRSGTMLQRLGLGLDGAVDAPEVPQEWLSLFPEGGELSMDTFHVDGFGKPLKGADLPAGARVGDYVLDENGTTGSFLTANGSRSPLDAFALQVYADSSMPGKPGRFPHELTVSDPSFQATERTYEGAHWPDGPVKATLGQVCARLDARHDDIPRAELASDPTGGAAAPTSLAAGQKRLSIEPGRGAYVRSGGWDETTSTSSYVIDPRGNAYALVGAGTAGQLGYDDSDATFVPDTWLKLFSPGVSLSTGKALCPPDLSTAPLGGAASASASPSPSPLGSPSASPSPGALDSYGCQEFLQ